MAKITLAKSDIPRKKRSKAEILTEKSQREIDAFWAEDIPKNLRFLSSVRDGEQEDDSITARMNAAKILADKSLANKSKTETDKSTDNGCEIHIKDFTE